MSFQGILALFDPVAKNFKAVRNILVTTLSAGSGSWTISGLPTTISNIYVIPAMDTSGLNSVPLVYWSFTSNTGTLTISLGNPSYSTAVTGVSVTTGVKVTGVSVSTGVTVDGVSYSTGAVIQYAGVSYASVVTSLSSDVGLWTSDSSGNLSHTHTVSTVSAVTGISTGSMTVVTGVSVTTGVKVTGVSVTTGVTVDGVSVSTGGFISSLYPSNLVTTKPLTVLIIW
jgi:hypothetical protein